MSSINRPELAKHDSSILDLAFIMDCTGSMGSYINNARDSIKKIVEEIVAMEKSDVRLALVEYRDHPPQENTFETRVHDFTESIKKMKEWLDNCSAQGGGDEPECVAEGLHAALKLNWRENSTKICVLVADAPPHGINAAGDTFPNGSPNGIDPIETVAKLAQKAITLYAVGCEPSLIPYKEFFSALAYKTGGQYVPLRNAELLAKVIIGGAVEEISLERLMGEVQEEVEKKKKEGVTDEKILAQAVESRLKSKGTVTNQILLNDSNIEKASEAAINFSKVQNLADLRKDFKPSPTPYSVGGYAMHSTAMSFPSVALASEHGHPLPSFTSGFGHSPAAVENYSVGRADISYAQSERLVQKALNRSKK